MSLVEQESKVNSLLASMTLEEKVGQLNLMGTSIYSDGEIAVDDYVT